MNFPINFNSTILVIILLVIILCIVCGCNYLLNNQENYNNNCNCGPTYAIRNGVHQVKKQENIEKMTDKNNNENKNKLYLYFTEWCGHSKNFLPEWDKLVSMVESSNLKNTFDVKKINCEKDKQTCEDANVRGYPTVILHKTNGQNVAYNGQRTAQDIMNFMKIA